VIVSDPQCSIGVDLGGQSVKLAVVDADGAVHFRLRQPVDPKRSAGEIGRQIIELVRESSAEAGRRRLSPACAGVVMPGYMDRDRSRLRFAANLPTLSGSDFLADLRSGLDLPVTFDADANAAALGEYRFGAGRGVRRLLVAVVGTGIGGGVIIEGEILRVRDHIAGSLGHVIVDARGPVCACGARGCVEALAAGPALERRAAEMARSQPGSPLAAILAERGRLTGEQIGEALSEHDLAAVEAVRECGWWLGAGVASWSAIYAPEKVLIGGGVAALGEPLLDAVRDGFREVGQPDLTGRVTIEAAALGGDAGVIGAAAMALAEPAREDG